ELETAIAPTTRGRAPGDGEHAGVHVECQNTHVGKPTEQPEREQPRSAARVQNPCTRRKAQPEPVEEALHAPPKSEDGERRRVRLGDAAVPEIHRRRAHRPSSILGQGPMPGAAKSRLPFRAECVSTPGLTARAAGGNPVDATQTLSARD